jgi:CheY-like chemotaxis protein
MSEAKRILVVEDDDVARELMRRTLARRGYDVTTAANGIEAYDLALADAPDLIITDIHMPAADGAHFVRRVRDTPGLLATPILVTTGYGTGSATLTLSQGADAFEPKPIDPETLLRSVERLLSKEPR